MFKIVQTFEKNKIVLTIVPANWELNNVLWWPRYRADKLIKIADSAPDDTWFKMKCKLKRNHLFNLEVAEEELERMKCNDDTEQEEDGEIMEAVDEGSNNKNRRPRVCNTKTNFNDHLNDFNSLASSCVQVLIIYYLSMY